VLTNADRTTRFVVTTCVAVTATISGLALALWPRVSPRDEGNDDIVAIAYEYPDGGGWKWEGSGAPEAVAVHGVELVPASADGTTFCNGFTFVVVMRSAEGRGLLDGMYVDDLHRFKKMWYADTKASAEDGAARALEETGLGRRVSFGEAMPGDFIHYQRLVNRTAHSAMFLGWVYRGEELVGFRYRGSQDATFGIGDHVEFFSDVPGLGGKVERWRFYIGRLAAGR